MIQHLILARARLDALFAAARSAVCLSRLLLLVVAVEVLTMPFTQGIWSWDKFLHGGQDFELGLLIIVTCLGFLLLRVQQNRGCFGGLMVIWALLLSAQKQAVATLLVRRTSFDHRSRIPSCLCPAALNLPLLI